MKKLFPVLLFVFFTSLLFYSCSKDNPVTTTGGGTNTGTIYYSSYRNSGHINVVSNGYTYDSIICNIPLDASVNAVVNVNLLLDSIEGVDVTKLSFTLSKENTSVMAIDLLHKSGSSFIGTILTDSATTPIDSGYSPYTGRFRPQESLSRFYNKAPGGTWKLRVYNRGSARTGVIKSWSITITYRSTQLYIFPGAVGNYWISEQRDALGNFMTYDTMKMLYSTTLNGKNVFRFYQSGKTDTVYVFNESDGAWAYFYINGIAYSQLIWKYPISVGEIYLGGGNGDTVICRSTTATVPTPSGTYTDCIKYEIHDLGAVSSIIYLKPGIGYIAEEHYNNGNLLDYAKLFSYQLY